MRRRAISTSRYEMDADTRFRCNYLKQTSGYGAVFRIIPTKIKTLEELGCSLRHQDLR